MATPPSSPPSRLSSATTFPDSEKREQARPEVYAKSALDLAQLEVNKAEAAHASLFVAGWQPFIGWVCGVAFAYHFVLQPQFAFVLANAGSKVELPAFDMSELVTVLVGMLGLGGMRTAEKIKVSK